LGERFGRRLWSYFFKAFVHTYSSCDFENRLIKFMFVLLTYSPNKTLTKKQKTFIP